MALGYASEKLKDDKDIVIKAIKSNYNSVQFASVNLLRDKEIALLSNSLRQKDGKKLDFRAIVNSLVTKIDKIKIVRSFLLCLIQHSSSRVKNFRLEANLHL
jgi:hypothetical protein